MEFIQKHKKQIAIGAGVVAAAGLVAGVWYFFFKKPSEDEVELDMQLSRSQILSEIQVERGPDGRLTVPTIKSLYHGIVEWSKGEYTKTVYAFRKARRSSSSNKEFVEANNKFQETLEGLLENAQKELLSKLSLESEEFDKTVEGYMRAGNQELFFIHMQLPHKMNASIPCKNSHEGISFKEVVKAQVEYLKNNRAELQELAKFCRVPQEELPGLVQTKLNDFVYEKFKIEEEDLAAIIKNGPEIIKDKEVQRLMVELQKETSKTVHVGGGMGGGMFGGHAHDHEGPCEGHHH
mmetsp:Transcript_9224/g.10389  ORF Transcript_9224/g.10389 Transcript_9224/m.10389 type:complete len:293 (-) Transcript_9224:203-1081(-)|eukprot:CAMPEP_0176428756 /NCGR_PEP_ID=MMETSP0127-20121128/13330_1 /TAXON_ID=938130 /ORGANISM="Platyophrya macrostoma, Strain WH" /LENGTH=292 /DNA_ID=CAMNT_0017810481 /DNA_START=38 /DNA_END=916 /DNA_ORIENTATION=-